MRARRVQLARVRKKNKFPFVRFSSPYPVTSVLGNVFTNLLGRQTKGTDLGSQSGLSSDLTTSHTQVTIEKNPSQYLIPL